PESGDQRTAHDPDDHIGRAGPDPWLRVSLLHRAEGKAFRLAGARTPEGSPRHQGVAVCLPRVGRRIFKLRQDPDFFLASWWSVRKQIRLASSVVRASRTVTFAPGQTSRPITVDLPGDVLD